MNPSLLFRVEMIAPSEFHFFALFPCLPPSFLMPSEHSNDGVNVMQLTDAQRLPLSRFGNGDLSLPSRAVSAHPSPSTTTSARALPLTVQPPVLSRAQVAQRNRRAREAAERALRVAQEPVTTTPSAMLPPISSTSDAQSVRVRTPASRERRRADTAGFIPFSFSVVLITVFSGYPYTTVFSFFESKPCISALSCREFACLSITTISLSSCKFRRARDVSVEDTVPAHYLGPFSHECHSCHALHWIAEKKSSSTLRNPLFSECCRSGDVDLPLLDPLPHDLQILYDGRHRQASDFRRHIRLYNKALAFTSTGGHRQLVGSSFDGRDPPHYKIQGEIFHRLGPIREDEGAGPVFSQLYI
jgi:hypothetical protein